MDYFGSFVALAAIPYSTGFFALCFWWRWRLLLLAGAIAAVFVGFGLVGALSGDGPGLPIGILIAYFLALGAACGFVASGAVLGRKKGWRMLKPAFALPVVFSLGFGSHIGLFLAHSMADDALFAPPPETCFIRRYTAQLGDIGLALPSAPGLTFFEKGSNRLRGLAHNPDIRYLCSKNADETIFLSSVSFALEDPSDQRTHEASTLFCSREHPEYPWAHMACRPRAVREIILDMPLYIDVAISNPSTNTTGSEHDRITKYPMSVRAGGLKIYWGEHSFFLQRPDGYLAECSSEEVAKLETFFRCHVKEVLFSNLTISYQFKTTEARFLQATPHISRTARAVFKSLMK